MTMTARLPAAVVLILTALATAAIPAPVAVAQGAATLTVHVTGVGGLPVADAEVNVSPAEADAEGETATTDASGNTSFDLAPGDYTVRVSATGYNTSTEDVEFSDDATLEVALEAAVETPVAKGDVVVLVLDEETGKALDDARVTLRFADRDEKHSARTDDDGRATFEGLLYGRGEVTAAKSGYEDASAKFTLASDEEDVRLELEEETAAGDATVDVRVRDTDGRPIEGATVQGNTWDGQTSGFDTATTDDDGRATLQLPAGRGGVSVSHEDYYGGYADFDATDGDADADVVLQEKPKPDATLTGVVVGGDGEPVANAELWIYVDYRWYEKMAAEGDARMAAPYYCCPDQVQATTDDDGRFEAKVYSGDLNIQTNAKGYAGQNDRAHVGPGDTEDIRIVLEKIPPKDAVLNGRVVDARTGLPVVGAGVNLNNLAWGDYQYATTDQAGRFELTTYPGYVQVNVWPNYGPVCYAVDAAASPPSEGGSGSAGSTEPAVAEDPAANTTEASGEGVAKDDVATSIVAPCMAIEKPQAQYYTFVTQLVLESGSNPIDAKLEQKPEPSTALVGYVVDPKTGDAIPGAWVNVRNEDTGEWGNAQTDEDGSYKIMVRPGHIVLDANAEGYYPKSETLTIGDDDRVRHDVELVAGTTRWVPCEECYYRAYDTDESQKGVPVAADGASSGGMASSLESQDSSLPPGAPAAFAAGPKTGTGANTFVGGGGGLGPYQANAATQRNEAPGLGLVAVLAAGALVAFAVRRR